MSVYIASLNSGSNGNCYYIGTDFSAILVDAGLSCRETEHRMARLGLSLHHVRAVFISHEHSDHIQGIEVLSKRFHLPVYMTEETHHRSRIKPSRDMVRHLPADGLVEIADMVVKAFPKNHDASDPQSFTITTKGITVGVFTDMGFACTHVQEHFSQCHAAFLETNYDEQMLTEGRYPAYLKKRIKGEFGHLSNMQALDLFDNYRSPFLSHLFLSHISAENNDTGLVKELFDGHAGNTRIMVASRYRESELICIK